MTDLPEFPMKTKPYDHQDMLVRETWDAKDYALFLEMGLGKSKVCIDTVAKQYREGKVDLVFVVAKKGVYTNWTLNELPAHLHDSIEHSTYTWYGLTTQKEQRSFDAWLSKPGLKFFVCNFEALKIKRCQQLINASVRKHGAYTVIMDESTAFKTRTTGVSKVIVSLCKKAKYRRILTGTPACEGPLDLYGQLLAFGPNPLGFSNYFSYKAKFCIEREMVMGNRRFKKVTGFKNLDTLTNRLAPFSTSLLKEDCLDLPPKIHQTVKVPFHKDQQKYYDELKQTALTMIQSEEITGVNALAIMVKLHQITCGQIKTDTGYLNVPNHKIDAVIDLCSESHSKVIVWSRFKGNQDMLQRALDPLYGAVAIRSSYSQKKRDELIDEWRQPDGPKVLIANPASLGHGVTLVECSTVIYFSNSFSLEQRLQSEDRCHRIGQTRPVNYYDLAIPGTIDEHVIRSLRTKRAVASEITGAEVLKGILQ